ncbi:MAG: hypothetical protein PHW54_06835 [Candidatus Omnitrophica bacterium]|nr:hypothetical protein [Candidatus Omnitrophota bacterium]
MGLFTKTPEEKQCQEIVRICRDSQAALDRILAQEGQVAAISALEPFEGMWQGYVHRFPAPLEIKGASFSRLLFHHTKLKNHKFLDCDFGATRWIFSFLEDCDFSDSSFAKMVCSIFPFQRSICANCDFSDAQLIFFEPFGGNKFNNAKFECAKLTTSHSFFNLKREGAQPSDFQGADMSGCNLIIQPENNPAHNKMDEEINALLKQLFSPQQLHSMRIDIQR